VIEQSGFESFSSVISMPHIFLGLATYALYRLNGMSEWKSAICATLTALLHFVVH
jgi:hypothetical protein